jgi:D-sedoheptulose 7-phosphate isomerase
MSDLQPSSYIPFNVAAFLHDELTEHREVFHATCQSIGAAFANSLDIIEKGIREGGKLLLFGNGGSAADAQHIAAELIIRYKIERAPIAAIALTTDSSALTACGNDMGFEAVFARQIDALGRAGDVAIGISTSGNSANVLAGLSAARKKGARTIGLTGRDGGKLPPVCDSVVAIPSSVTARIQEMHVMIGHMWCKALEQRLGLV